MQEHGRRHQTGGQVAEVDDFVECVELPGVVEAKEDEGRQAQHIKVPRLLRAAAAEVDEQADHQVGESHQVLIGDGQIQRHFPHDDGGVDLHPKAADVINGLAPRADAHQHLSDVGGIGDGNSVD
jgi:hypothetical protein